MPLPGSLFFFVTIGLILAAALGPAAYSVAIYKQLERRGEIK